MLPAPTGGIGDFLLTQSRPGSGEPEIDARSESSHGPSFFG
jgi:hypothetical protein